MKKLLLIQFLLCAGFASVHAQIASTTNTGFQPASIGDRIWLDNGAGGGVAGDGLQNGTEPGVANVVVSLYQNGTDGVAATADDVFLGSVITDVYGRYSFGNLVPTDQAAIAQTSYNIRITAPLNYVFTQQSNTTDNQSAGNAGVGSDVNASGVSYSINVQNGSATTNIDAGLMFQSPAATSSIGDRVWFDKDGNGLQDAGEPGVSGVTVSLLDDATGAVLATTTSDATGKYLFNNFAPGVYRLAFSAPAGTVLTAFTGTTTANGSLNSDADPATGQTSPFNLASSASVITGLDAGITNDTKGSIGDLVWNDINENGVQDPGEPGIPNVTLNLYGPGPNHIIGGNDDVLLATTTTDATGHYVFSRLVAGKYFVVATLPQNYNVTALNTTVGNPGGISQDNDFADGTNNYNGFVITGLKTLLPSFGGTTRDMTTDLGMYTSVSNLNSLGDRVWNDMNRNGIQDPNEPGMQNITVSLLDGAGNAVVNAASGLPYTTSTAADGSFHFYDLADGQYMLQFSNLPAGYSFTKANAVGSGAPGSGTDSDSDNDAATSTGRTAIIDLDAAGASAASVDITNVDAGVFQGRNIGMAALGNRVWIDSNGNGVQDAGETGAANIRVELTDASGTSIDADPATPGVQPTIRYTNALGEYLFTGLSAGDYKIKFSGFPVGYSAAPANIGGNDETDADASFIGTAGGSTTAISGTYSLADGEQNLRIDMGIIPPAGTNSLGGTAWNDVNQDGIHQSGEYAVAGVTVALYKNGTDNLPVTPDDVFVAATVTDSSGHYSFAGLSDGNYNVGFMNLSSGYRFTTQHAAGTTTSTDSDPATAGGRTGTIALDPNSMSASSVNDNSTDAGLISQNAAVGNYAWLDANGDGIQNNSEPALGGVAVTLYASDNSVVGSTFTDAAGKYFFDNITPGSYTLGFSTSAAGLAFTQTLSPGDNGISNNSDANPANGTTAAFTLTAGETNLSFSAGFRPDNFASVGDLVWNDINADGEQDQDEPGVPGIIATLLDGANNVIGSAISKADGSYLIDHVPAGTYYIRFSNLPGGASFTDQTSDVTPSDGTYGSDANALTGKTASFVLADGEYLPTVDAGIKQVLLLPVKLISFTAQAENDKVKLVWDAEMQSNLSGYQVEFSADGINFSGISFVAASNSASQLYTAFHNKPVPGINYYRLKMIDPDGAISYSEIRKVIFGKISVASVYPNPAKTTCTLSFSGAICAEPIAVFVFDAQGKLVAKKQFQTGGSAQTLDVSGLPNGNYILKTVGNGQTLNNILSVVK